MKTKTELEKEILNVTMKIHNEFPELSKYIAEMPMLDSGKDIAGLEKGNLKEYYNSLVNLIDEYSKTHVVNNSKKNTEPIELPRITDYPPSEDIYSKGKKEMELNPEDISKRKTPNEVEGSSNEKDFEEDMSGDDLDVPGSELDDKQEDIGSEDEENNYYSLGGDNHNDLEEDKG